MVPCGGLEVPAHERGMLSGGLEVPAHARVASNGGSGEAPVRWVCSGLGDDYVARNVVVKFLVSMPMCTFECN